MTALQALSDPTRQRIVEMLAAGALSSGEIAGRFALSPPAISQHLKTLKQARLVTVRADKQKRIYTWIPKAWRKFPTGWTASAPSGTRAWMRWKRP